jgi:hypothetical protein
MQGLAHHALPPSAPWATRACLLQQNEQRGIDAFRFGELLMTSGVVLNDEIRWITFHR